MKSGIFLYLVPISLLCMTRLTLDLLSLGNQGPKTSLWTVSARQASLTAQLVSRLSVKVMYPGPVGALDSNSLVSRKNKTHNFCCCF